jgi:hypothetical protein
MAKSKAFIHADSLLTPETADRIKAAYARGVANDCLDVELQNAGARYFSTGATRDVDDGKLDYEGFLHPLVIQRFAEYMHEHRVQSDGELRDADNWQKGMPLNQYIKSMFRHFMDLWHAHRGTGEQRSDPEEALCAIIFNAQGYLFELLIGRDVEDL